MIKHIGSIEPKIMSEQNKSSLLVYQAAGHGVRSTHMFDPFHGFTGSVKILHEWASILDVKNKKFEKLKNQESLLSADLFNYSFYLLK
jgi:hypothetical protein